MTPGWDSGGLEKFLGFFQIGIVNTVALLAKSAKLSAHKLRCCRSGSRSHIGSYRFFGDIVFRIASPSIVAAYYERFGVALVSEGPASLSNMDWFASRLAAAVSEKIGASRYELWFAKHTIFELQPEEVTVGVRNEHFQEWLSKTFQEPLLEAVAEVLGKALPLRFVVDPRLGHNESPKASASESLSDKQVGDHSTPGIPGSSPNGAPSRPGLPTRKTLFGEEPLPLPRAKKPRTSEPIRRWKTLQDFVTGACNRVAHASAMSVVEDPGQSVNPLVLHGPVGTGKSHLLQGIYHGLRKRWSNEGRPLLVSAEEFTTRFVQATRFGKQSGFRRQFRDCYALLLDDLQILATKRATQEEFLYTFDSLLAEGRQIVVTMDCHPRLAEELMPELVDRLLGGAIWSLLPPDDETRLGILRQRAGGAGPPIPDDVLHYLARHLTGNVRELEGAIHSVRHYARVTEQAVTPALAREALGDLLRHSVRAMTLADVDAAVCTVLRLPRGTLQSKGRSWAVSHPRMLAIYVARKQTTATYSEISRYFGAKNHSTAVAGEKKIRERIQNNERIAWGDREWPVRDLVERIERELLR